MKISKSINFNQKEIKSDLFISKSQSKLDFLIEIDNFNLLINIFDLLIKFFDLLIKFFDLLINIFDLLINSFDLLINSFDLLISSFDLLISSFNLLIYFDWSFNQKYIKIDRLWLIFWSKLHQNWSSLTKKSSKLHGDCNHWLNCWLGIRFVS